MPNRILKESICTSESIDVLTWQEECFFYRLIVNCDDYGRMDARSQVILAKCFPLKIGTVKTSDIEKMVLSLQKVGVLVKYNEGKHIQLLTWDKHQQVRAKKSKYPQPTDEEINGNHLIADDDKCPRNPIQSESNPNPIRNTSARKRAQKKSSDREGVVEYAELVFIKSTEADTLINKYGKDGYQWMLAKLSNYKKANGKEYVDDYAAINGWVKDELAKSKTANFPGQHVPRQPRYKFKQDCKYCNGKGKYTSNIGGIDTVIERCTCGVQIE